MTFIIASKTRIDKYLWAIRIFKTRSLASEACSKGRVVLKNQSLKSSYNVKTGDIYEIKINPNYKKIIEVKTITDKRGSATTAKEHYVDHSPPFTHITKEIDAFFTIPSHNRSKGTGRPTKKERRAIKEDFDL